MEIFKLDLTCEVLSELIFDWTDRMNLADTPQEITEAYFNVMRLTDTLKLVRDLRVNLEDEEI